MEEFDSKPKTHDRANILCRVANEFVEAEFGEMRDEVAKFKKKTRETIGRYVEWVARRNELAHGYVTEAQSPDYSQDDQPIIAVYALLPSHARADRWYHDEPEWNYLASEIEEFARQFGILDGAFELLAGSAAELRLYRTKAIEG